MGGRVQRRANPPGTRKAEEVLTAPKRRPLRSEPLAQGLREGGMGLAVPSSPSLPLGSAGVGGPLSPGTQGPAYTILAGSSIQHLCCPLTPAPQSSFWLPALAVQTPPPSNLFHGSPGPPGQAHVSGLPAMLRLLPHYFQPLAALSPLPGHPYPLSDARLQPLPSQAGAQMPPPPGSSTVPVPPSLVPWQGLLTKQGVTIGTEKQRFPLPACLDFPPFPGRPLGVVPSPPMQRLMIGEVTPWMGETGAG